jgi:hypothetical protein
VSGSTGVSLPQIQAFVANNYAAAAQASQQTGLPVDYILGQAGLESAYGTSNVAQTTNNLFGITQSGGGYVSYPSTTASFQGYANYLTTNQRYSNLSSVSNSDPATIANYLATQGYNPNPSTYSTAVAGATSTVDSALTALGLSPTVSGTTYSNGSTMYITPDGVSGGSSAPVTGGTGTTTTATPGSTTSPTAGTSSTPSTLLGYLGYTGSWGSAVSSLLFVIIGIILLIGAVIMYSRSQGK